MTPRLSHPTAALLDAVAFAADKHRHQRRKGADASPYINHPIEVADRLANVAGVTELAVLQAAILHDTIEDTETTADELEARFGPVVRGLVEEVTDDQTKPREVRKRLQIEMAPGLSAGARLIKISDKLANLLDMAERPPAGWSGERRREYADWAERVVGGCRGVSAPLEALFDEAVRRAREALARES
jgi:guanosine-3',5'-bis(diphosphate) 3'-pyrophosphohydrolase